EADHRRALGIVRRREPEQQRCRMSSARDRPPESRRGRERRVTVDRIAVPDPLCIRRNQVRRQLHRGGKPFSGECSHRRSSPQFPPHAPPPRAGCRFPFPRPPPPDASPPPSPSGGHPPRLATPCLPRPRPAPAVRAPGRPPTPSAVPAAAQSRLHGSAAAFP